MANLSQRPQPLFDWFIPIDGDGAHIGTHRAERPPTFEYLRRVVETAEELGFHSLLIPTRFTNGLFDEGAPLAETWTTVTALGSVTTRIRFLVAVRPGFISTGLFAQMAATLDQITGGRLDINVVPGGIQGDYERFGDASSHGDRYARSDEFIGACRALWESPDPVVFKGEYVNLDGATCSPGPLRRWAELLPRRSLRSRAGPGRTPVRRLLDVDRNPRSDGPDTSSERKRSSRRPGRPPSFGLRTHLIARGTEQEAWDAAEELLSRAESGVREQRSRAYAGTPMAGQRTQAREAVEHRLGPHLWNGISTVRVNCGTAIVGSYEQVASELLEYWRLGIDEFILSGYPHVEECRRVASEVLPIVRSSDSGREG